MKIRSGLRGRVASAIFAGSVAAVLAGCPGREASRVDPLVPSAAWTGAAPPNAKTIDEAAFRAGIADGSIAPANTATSAAQRKARREAYVRDLAALRAQPVRTRVVEALLRRAARGEDADVAPTLALDGDRTVTLQSLAHQVADTAKALERARDPANALGTYTLGWQSLPPALQSRHATPDSLKGKPLADIQRALATLDAADRTRPDLDRVRAIRAPVATRPISRSLVPVPGNGQDNDRYDGGDPATKCRPAGLAGRAWFPLKAFVSPVKDQGSRGMCWAFTSIGAVESRALVQDDRIVDLSEQFLANKVKREWSRDDDEDGYNPETAMDDALDHEQALAPETAWTYNRANRKIEVPGTNTVIRLPCEDYTGTCSATAHESQAVCFGNPTMFCGYETMRWRGDDGLAASRTNQLWGSGDAFLLSLYRDILASGHALMGSFDVQPGMESRADWNGYVTDYHSNDDGGGHAVLFVGFVSNDDIARLRLPDIAPAAGGGYFIVRNSWGCNYGDAGYFYVPATWVEMYFRSLATLVFDNRRGANWRADQADPGSLEAPTVTALEAPPAAQVRVPYDIRKAFRVQHLTAHTVRLSVSSNLDGVLYDGPMSLAADTIQQAPPLAFRHVGIQHVVVVASVGDHRSQLVATDILVQGTAPTLSLRYDAVAYVGEPAAFAASVSDPNEPNAATLCPQVAWRATAPDTVAPATGCDTTLRFAQTGLRTVRVQVRDSDGQTGAAQASIYVQPASASPYPRITSAGVFSRQYTTGRLRYCGDIAVASGSEIKLAANGCRLMVSGPAPSRYYGKLAVDNPRNEALRVDWALIAIDFYGNDRTIISNNLAIDAVFNLDEGRNNTSPVTRPCRLEATVRPNDAARVRKRVVWSGQCSYLAGYVG